MKKLISLAGVCVLLGGCMTQSVTTFEECQQAGGAILESDPLQCEYGGVTFTQEKTVSAPADDSSSSGATDSSTGNSQPGKMVGMANPASVNCTKNGGTLQIQKKPSGGEYGVCYFEDNLQCEEWAMMRGQCPVGGVKVTGYDNDAEIYCAITGGTVEDMDTDTPMCKRTDGTLCNAQDNFAGNCPAILDPSAGTAPDAGNEGEVAEITTFEECAAKYPTTRSYPAQCTTPDGRHFVQELDQ